MTHTLNPVHFIDQLIKKDLVEGRVTQIHTRFPPEPNGYLHIGHAKSICLNFGLAQKYNGLCNLRFDDTNPEKEDQTYIDAIIKDIHWLGFSWSGESRHAADYFHQLYEWAKLLIQKGKAYMDFSTLDQVRDMRGTLKSPGTASEWRDKPAADHLIWFEKMKAGDYKEGEVVLRAKIDLASPNMNMRDPVMYRTRHVMHHRAGEDWCIYPSYDYAHGLSDAIEHITHSICTLEFEDHRPLYNWFISQLPVPFIPRQYEFARLNLNYTVTSKRKLKQLVDHQLVDGWDDPRMPTISGLRRRGVPASAIRKFCDMIGVTRSDSVVDVSMLEFAIREELNTNAFRAMAVLNSVKVTITNYPEDRQEVIDAPVHPQNESLGTRKLSMSRTLWIDRADFVEIKPNKKWKRLFLHGEVRLRYGYIVRCDEIITDSEGNIIELRCSYDPESLGVDPVGRKVKGVIHWVDVATAISAEVRLYDRLFSKEIPDADSEQPFTNFINPDSVTIVSDAKLEPMLLEAPVEVAYQFEREGYFCRDNKLSSSKQLIFNRTIGLKDSWIKCNK